MRELDETAFTERELKIFKEIQEYAKKYQTKKVVLFGSRARRTNREKSDISSLLDQFGIDLLVNKDEEQAMVDLKYFNDACKTYPSEGIVEDMKEFINLLEERKM